VIYIQRGMNGPARIGRVEFSKSGRSIYYGGKTFRKLESRGYKTTHYDIETREEYWISGPRRDGADGLYGYRPTPIDDDAREEYWIEIRKQPSQKNRKFS